MNDIKTLTVGEKVKSRIDVFLSGKFPDYSRGYFQKLIKNGDVKLNGSEIMPSHALKPGDSIIVEFVVEKKDVPSDKHIELNIIYEDDDVLVVNKQPGLVVHPACGHESGTLLNALMAYAGEKFVPLMVHRLDKDTSGVLVIAKNERAKKSLVKQFQHRAIKKVYLAAVKGLVADKKGYIDAPLGRSGENRKMIVVGPLAKREAVTEFTTMHSGKEYSLLEVRPLTGRTHQIRSHLSYIGHPVLGDPTYGGPEKTSTHAFKRQMLHAFRITFTHPSKGKRVVFEAPIPNDMKDLLKEGK
jgi:23S rRNA pseudouridine1911/1915/1917 synthase